MFKRKLKALGHHSPDSFDIKDDAQFRNCVVWLEDKSIRLYKISEREPLRCTTEPGWKSVLQKYLHNLHAPINKEDNAAVLAWLLGYAVRLKYKRQAHETPVSNPAGNQASGGDADSLCNLTADNETLRAAIDSLATALSVPRHNDHIITLQALKLLIDNQLSQAAISRASAAAETAKVQSRGTQAGERVLQDVFSGLAIDDCAVEDVTRIIRLLHIKELRDVQTKVNEAIVSIQKLTANPITDQTLGRVGR